MRDGWVETTLGEVGLWYSGSTPKATRAEFYGGPIPFVAIGDLTGGPISETERTITDAGLNVIGRLAPVGSVFLSMYGSIGKVGIATRPMATNQAITWVECDLEICDPRFILVWLSWKSAHFGEQGRGATQRNINREIVKRTTIVLPPLDEQQRIVDLIASVDDVLRAASHLRAQTELSLFTYLSDFLATNRAPRVRLSDVAVPDRGLVGGPFGSSLVSKDYVPEGVPVIRGANLSGGRWVCGDFAFVSEDKADSLSGNLALPGDLIATQRGTLGQVAIVPAGPFTRLVVSQSQMRLRADPAVASAHYLYAVLRSRELMAEIESRKIATANPHINLGIFGALEVPLPAKQVQDELASRIKAFDELLDHEDRHRESLTSARRALLADLLSGDHEIPKSYDAFLDAA